MTLPGIASLSDLAGPFIPAASVCIDELQRTSDVDACMLACLSAHSKLINLFLHRHPGLDLIMSEIVP